MKRDLITREERETIERINNDCLAMHVCPPPVTFVGMEVKDAKGEVVDAFEMKSNSWVRNQYNSLWAKFTGAKYIGGSFGAGTNMVKRVDGTVESPGYDSWPINGSSGSAARGIVVGTGTGVESLDSYAMGALIASGNSAGQLAYSAGTSSSVTYDSGTKKYTITYTRIMNNNSGASISVNEVGMVSDSPYFLLSRDKLDSPVAVPNGGQLTVTYTIEMTFPG